MVRPEVFEILQGEGVAITPAKLDRAIASGRVGPIEMDGARNRIFRSEHLAQLKNYVANPPPTGRPPKTGNR